MGTNQSKNSDEVKYSVSHLADACVSKFDKRSPAQSDADKAVFETWQLDLRLWADIARASTEGSSDSSSKNNDDDKPGRLSLFLLDRNLEDYWAKLEANQPTGRVVGYIRKCMETLTCAQDSMKHSCRVSRRCNLDLPFNPDDYADLRRHLEFLLLIRPSKRGPPELLDPSTLTQIQKRLIDANLLRRHHTVVARIHSQEAPQVHGSELSPCYLKVQSPGTVIDTDAELPIPPPIPPGWSPGKCPCCSQFVGMEERFDSKLWSQHIDANMLPYTCIIEECPSPAVFFATKEEWDAHVTADHAPRWVCTDCSYSKPIFRTENKCEDHLYTTHRIVYTQVEDELDRLKTIPRGISKCPICPFSGQPDYYNTVDHVMKHVREFSLRSLPWPKPITHDLTRPVGTFNLPADKGHAERLLHWITRVSSEPFGDLNLIPTDLQLSSFDTANHDGVDFTDRLDKAHYVPGKVYFDTNTMDDSCIRQNTMTESSITRSKSSKTPSWEPAVTSSAFAVGWICALPVDAGLVVQMLDDDCELWSSLVSEEVDYRLGWIGCHMIVIASSPADGSRNMLPDSLAQHMVTRMPSIKVLFMVGIDSGNPPSDARPGDVNVTWHTCKFPGVVHPDSGPRYVDQVVYDRPKVVLNALASLRADQGNTWYSMPRIVGDHDEPGFDQKDTNSRCQDDLQSNHDALNKAHDGKFLEANQKAAGLVGMVPCVAIIGISNDDDADTAEAQRKHATTVAAGLAKELLLKIGAHDFKQTQTIDDMCQGKTTAI